MSILQRRNQISKQNRARGLEYSVAASLEDFELESQAGDQLCETSPAKGTSDGVSIAGSEYSRNIPDEYFARWAYPSPNSIEKWSAAETEEDEPEDERKSARSRVHLSASPISSATSASQNSASKWRRAGWFDSSRTDYESAKSPSEPIFFAPSSFRVPTLSTIFRRQVYSDTPAPACTMSSPGAVGRREESEAEARKPFRHSASPIPPTIQRSDPTRRQPEFFWERPALVRKTMSKVAMITAQLQGEQVVPSEAEDVFDSGMTERPRTPLDRAFDALEPSAVIVGSNDGVMSVSDIGADEPVSASTTGYESGQMDGNTAANVEDVFTPDSPVRKSLGRSRKVSSKVIKRRRKKEPISYRHERQGVKTEDDGFFSFDMHARMNPGYNPLTAFFSFIHANAFVSGRWIWSTMMWLCGLGLTFMICRSVLWSSASEYLIQGSSSGMMVPDLIKVAGLARSFEPLIHFSEHGVRQIGELEDSGVAVWDLGESVRQTNMTSGPIIVKELDELGQSLNLLALEMTRFYTSVDSDMDNILIVMDWARRELGQVMVEPASSPAGQVYDRIVDILADSGIIESEHDLSVNAITYPVDSDSDITPRKKRPKSFFSTLARMSTAYRTRSTLQITFLELVGALEEAIANELRASTTLFSLFERVDRQFNNLQRLVAREQAGQERAETDALESLWTRLTGGNIAALRKFQNNRRLLGSLRECTKGNKALLSAHNHRLLALRTGLETLRKRLVRPLVRSQVDGDDGDNLLMASAASVMLAMSPSSTTSAGLAGLPDQIHGIEAAYDHLQRVREGQRSRVMRLVYGVEDDSGPPAVDRRTLLGSVGGRLQQQRARS